MSGKKNPKNPLTFLRSAKTKKSETKLRGVRAKIKALRLIEKHIDGAIRWLSGQK